MGVYQSSDSIAPLTINAQVAPHPRLFT